MLVVAKLVVDHPFAQDLLALGAMNNFEIAFDGDENETQFGGNDRTPENVLTEQPHARPIPRFTDEREIAELGAVRYQEKDATNQIQ